MKKLIAVLLTIVLSCTFISCAFADNNTEGGFFDSIGSFFSNAWKDVSDWVETAIDDISAWIDGAWGDASEWVSQAWDDSSDWVTEIWGEVSTWVSETYESASDSVSTWWVETFDTVTDSTKDAWKWTKDSFSSLNEHNRAFLVEMKNALSSTDDEESLKIVVFKLLNEMGIDDKNAEKVWLTIHAYAEEKGISPLLADRIILPYLFQLKLDSDHESAVKIPAIAIAQYLTAILEKTGVKSDDVANKLLIELLNTLNEF